MIEAGYIYSNGEFLVYFVATFKNFPTTNVAIREK